VPWPWLCVGGRGESAGEVGGGLPSPLIPPLFHLSLPPIPPSLPFTTPQATEIYKRLLLENRGELALNVYVAMCYYKMDYYDVALEILAVYLQVRPRRHES
jgi:hypothetical protein